MSDINLKIVPLRPKRRVPPDATPLTEEGIVGQLAEKVGKMAHIQNERMDFIEKTVLGLRKELTDIRTGTDFNEARLNRVIRLGKVLADKAGVPD